MAMRNLMIPIGLATLAIVALLMFSGVSCCRLVEFDEGATVPTATTPAGTVTYTSTQKPVFTPVVTTIPDVTPTPTPSTRMDAIIIDSGTTKTTYARGETAEGYIILKNTGDVAITEVMLGVTAQRSVPFLGYVTVGSVDYPYTGINILPGANGEIRFSQEIPADYKGISTAGDYRLIVKVSVGGKEIGTITKDIKVT